MQKVKNHHGLMKDGNTGAVVNTQRSAIRKAKEIKRRLLEKDNRIDELESRLAKIEKLLEDK